MEKLDYNKVIENVVKIINKNYEQVSQISKITKKENNDIVTDIDLFMEKNLIKELSDLYPSHSFCAEESGEKINNNNIDNYEWMIDPIDGTVNFVSGLPDFGIVVALQKNGETVLGVSVHPKLGETYTVIKGHGAYLNGEKISVNKNKNLNDSVVMVYTGSKFKDDIMKKVCKLIFELNKNCRGVRIVGSSSVCSCWVASGKLDAIINLKSTISLGSLVGRLCIEEAGGKVTNVNNKKRQRVDTLLCSNGLIHDKLVSIIEKYNVKSNNYLIK